jgi:xanthine dehydrogenase accessory factor
VRGLLHSGLEVTTGFKLGDVDFRAREHCFTVSDKALAVAAGVLEAACSPRVCAFWQGPEAGDVRRG